MWRAGSLSDAIRLAEAEAASYAGQFEDYPLSYAGFAQAYELDDEPDNGAEVFSLLRDSELAPEDYLTSFFDTGREHQGTESADTSE